MKLKSVKAENEQIDASMQQRQQQQQQQQEQQEQQELPIELRQRLNRIHEESDFTSRIHVHDGNVATDAASTEPLESPAAFDRSKIEALRPNDNSGQYSSSTSF